MKNVLRALKITTTIFGLIAAFSTGIFYGMDWFMRQSALGSLAVVGGFLFAAVTFYIWAFIDAKII